MFGGWDLGIQKFIVYLISVPDWLWHVIYEPKLNQRSQLLSSMIINLIIEVCMTLIPRLNKKIILKYFTIEESIFCQILTILLIHHDTLLHYCIHCRYLCCTIESNIITENKFCLRIYEQYQHSNIEVSWYWGVLLRYIPWLIRMIFLEFYWPFSFCL